MIWLDIYSGANKLGDGPVVHLLSFETTRKLSAAGSWSAVALATDPRAADLLQEGRTALAYRATAAQGVEFIGGGPIEDVRVKVADDGRMTLAVSGADLLAELAQVTAGYVESSNGETTLRGAMPAGWTIVETDTLPAWTARYAHDSVLAGWVRAASRVGFRFRLAPSGATIRRLQLLTTTPASGVRAWLVADPLAIEGNLDACLLQNIEEARSMREVINRFYVYGAGNWETRLTLQLATLWPDGSAVSGAYTDDAGNEFTLTAGSSQLDCTTSQSTYGVRAAAIQFADVAPLTNSTADMQAAANALLRAACLDMAARVTAQYAYSLDVAALRQAVLPGDSIYVDAQRWIDGQRPINIQRTLLVLETSLKYAAGSPVPVTGLTVATTDRLPLDDSTAVAQAIQGTINMAALPQAGTVVDTICANDALDDDATANFRFWLGEEVNRVYQVLMRYRVDPLRSTAKSVGGSASGSVDLPTHTHDVTISSHTHGVTIDDHDHGITVYGLADPTSNGLARIVYFEPDNNRFTAAFGASNDEATSTGDGGGDTVTSAGGGGATVTSASGGGATGIEVDISSALTLDYGIFEETGGNTYAYSDLQWTVNGVPVTESPTSLGSGWYSLDLTDYVVASDGIRPAAAANTVAVSIKTASKTGKTVQVTVQIERRFAVQPIAYR